MRNTVAALAAFLCAAAAAAHITPNVSLLARGEFLRQNLPGATRFFEKQMMICGPDGAAIRKATGSFGSAVMYQRNTWVSKSSLIALRTHAGSLPAAARRSRRGR